MSLEVVVALICLAAVILYAVLAGADFGGGVWDLFAGGPRAVEQRKAIGEAMGPVWETNHVWLIYVLVLLFTCFPPVFAILGEKLFLPLTLALLGIVLRGAAFAFRGPAYRDLLPYKVWGVIFGIASILTPFFFGACVAGIASGSFDWHGPMSMAVGLFAIALCSQLAAVYLTAETLGELREDFRRRAYVATLGVAAAGLLALLVAGLTERALVAQLFTPAPTAIIAVAMVLGIVVLVLLRFGRALWARAVVVAEVASVLCAWFVAQAPYAQRELGIAQPAAPDVTLVLFLWATAVGAVVLLPSLWLLFAVFKREPLGD